MPPFVCNDSLTDIVASLSKASRAREKKIFLQAIKYFRPPFMAYYLIIFFKKQHLKIFRKFVLFQGIRICTRIYNGTTLPELYYSSELSGKKKKKKKQIWKNRLLDYVSKCIFVVVELKGWTKLVQILSQRLQCVGSNVCLTQNAIRNGGNSIFLLWLWRSVEKGAILGTCKAALGFFVPFFPKLGVRCCNLIYFPISFC